MDKERFQVEHPINSSKGVLFNMFSTPSGLAEWFCDDVNIKKDVHIFLWDGSEESARLVTKKRDEFVKFRWIAASTAGSRSARLLEECSEEKLLAILRQSVAGRD